MKLINDNYPFALIFIRALRRRKNPIIYLYCDCAAITFG